MDRAEKSIVKEVSSWQGVIAGAHSFGGTEFRLGRRELGHVHGDRWADIVFPMEVRDRLVAEGRAEPHHILPRSGWVTFRFREEGDVGRAIGLFRLSYELAEKSLVKPSHGTRVEGGPAAERESSQGS